MKLHIVEERSVAGKRTMQEKSLPGNVSLYLPGETVVLYQKTGEVALSTASFDMTDDLERAGELKSPFILFKKADFSDESKRAKIESDILGFVQDCTRKRRPLSNHADASGSLSYSEHREFPQRDEEAFLAEALPDDSIPDASASSDYQKAVLKIKAISAIVEELIARVHREYPPSEAQRQFSRRRVEDFIREAYSKLPQWLQATTEALAPLVVVTSSRRHLAFINTKNTDVIFLGTKSLSRSPVLILSEEILHAAEHRIYPHPFTL